MSWSTVLYFSEIILLINTCRKLLYMFPEIEFVYDRQSLCWRKITSESLSILHSLMTTTPYKWTSWFYLPFSVCNSHLSGVLEWIRHVIITLKIKWLVYDSNLNRIHMYLNLILKISFILSIILSCRSYKF